MKISLDQFQILTFVFFFFYVFLDTKIFLTLWAALFHIIQLTIRSMAINTEICKAVITAYVIVILAGYLYTFRDVLISSKKISEEKLEAISSDKKRQRRIGIAILLLIVINVTGVVISSN